MRDGQDRKGKIGRETIAIIVAAFVLLFVLMMWGPWNSPHVASNPGPSGTPGSTVVNRAPPPAAGPSGDTSGMAR
jgi:hypothetical protein